MQNAIGRMIVYRVEKNKGYTLDFLAEFEEIDPSKLQGTVEYIDILDINGNNRVAVKVGKKLYTYNGQKMEEQDIVEEDIEIVKGDTGSLQHFQNNWYKRQFAFDCMIEERQEGSHQPVAGLQVQDGRIEVITHAFSYAIQMPIASDIVEYRGKFWTVEEVQTSYTYAPREQKTLHIVLKEISNAV